VITLKEDLKVKVRASSDDFPPNSLQKFIVTGAQVQSPTPSKDKRKPNLRKSDSAYLNGMSDGQSLLWTGKVGQGLIRHCH